MYINFKTVFIKNKQDFGKNKAKILTFQAETIVKLKEELANTRNKLQLATKSELTAKNDEIERLKSIVSKMQDERQSSLVPVTTSQRFSLEQLFESFNDLKFQQAMDIKKNSQMKIDELMNEISGMVNLKTQLQVKKLQAEMAVVVEKQEVADCALNQCAELCSYTLEHLHELARFLTVILQRKEIRDTLNDQSLMDIQNVLDKSRDLSRRSIDGRFSSLANISSFDALLTTARDSIANFRDVHKSIANVVEAVEKTDEAIQVSIVCEKCKSLTKKLDSTSTEYDELRRINQMLEDEICDLKDKVKFGNEDIKAFQEEINSMKEAEDEVNILLEDYQQTIEKMQVEKIDIEAKLKLSTNQVEKCEKRLNEITNDLNANWITKRQHEGATKKLRDEIVSGEAQVAAIRMELDEIRKIVPKLKRETKSVDVYKTYSDEDYTDEDDKENKDFACALLKNESQNTMDYSENDSSKSMLTTRRTIEISDDRKRLLMSTSEISTSCSNCLKYQSRNRELKEYLGRAVETLKKQAEQKSIVDKHIQKQLHKTEDFLQQARSNMENIFKNKKN